MSKHEIRDPSTTTEADRALRLRKDLIRRAQQRSLRAERAAIELERAKATRRLVQENERLKQEARHG